MKNPDIVPFVNIHTHGKRRRTNAVEIYNWMPGEELPAGYFSAGMHPWQIKENFPGEDWEKVRQVVQNPMCVAVGETGMDRMPAYRKFTDMQEKVFHMHLELANQTRKPLIVHCVRCYDLLIAWRKHMQTPVIIHGFSRGPALARQLTEKYGFYLSFGYYLLINQKMQESLREIPAENIFLETDDKNVSIEEIYETAAGVLNIPLEVLKQRIYSNYKKIFPA